MPKTEQEFLDVIENLQDDKTDLHAEIDELESRAVAAETERDALQDRVDTLQAAVNDGYDALVDRAHEP